jgi:hypothetical protein
LQQGTKAIFAITATGLMHRMDSGARAWKKRQVLHRFALFSDGHYGQKDTNYAGFHTQMVDWLNAEHKARGLDFAVANGDLFHDNPAFVPELKGHLARLTMPWYPCHGNHDMMPESDWQQAFGHPYNFVVEKKQAAFVFLNTADEKGKYICEPVDWMKDQLKQFAGKKHLVVIMHITPFNWTANGKPHPEMVQLFDAQTNLKAVFHGHDHDIDDWKEHNGKFYFFDGHTGGNWGKPYRGYRMVELWKDGTLATWQMDPATDATVNTKTLDG